MGKSRYWVHQCSICPYSSGRKENAKRHNELVHKGAATISIRNTHAADNTNQLGSGAALDHMTFFDKVRSNNTAGTTPSNPGASGPPAQKNVDFFSSLVKELEPEAESIRRLDRLMRPPANYWNWSFPPPAPLEWPAPNLNARPNPQSPNLEEEGPAKRVRIGCRGFTCDKCYEYGLVEFGLNFKGGKVASWYGGICSHSCSGQPDPAEEHDKKKKKKYALDELGLLMFRALSSWIGSEMYLHISEMPSAVPSQDKIAEELNPIDFGPARPDDPIYSAIKSGAGNVKLTKEMLSDFFDKTKASYYLATFEDEGKKRLFFLIIGAQPTSEPK